MVGSRASTGEAGADRGHVPGPGGDGAGDGGAHGGLRVPPLRHRHHGQNPLIIAHNLTSSQVH